MEKLTLNKIRQNGIELANFTLRSYTVNGHRHDYSDKPLKAYVFYYENEYIVYTYIYHAPIIQRYISFNDALDRLNRFVNAVINR